MEIMNIINYKINVANAPVLCFGIS